MSNLFATAGSKLHIGTAAMAANDADFTASDFNPVSWTEIGGTTNLGSAGDTANLITSDQIARQRTRKLKGTRNAGSMEVMCDLNYADAGQLALIAAEKTQHTYPFRLVFNDAPAPRSSTVTISIAEPGVVTWTAHGLTAGDQVRFSTTDTLPTGLVAGTTYFVVSPDANTFSVSATKGGTPIETTATQDGTHTATTVPTASERYFVALVMSAGEQYDEANSVMKLNATLEIDSNIVRVAPTGA